MEHTRSTLSSGDSLSIGLAHQQRQWWWLVILVHHFHWCLATFNTNHPSWFSRTGDVRAVTRGEALDGAINSSQLTIANQDLPTSLPSQGQPSPDITLLSLHLLPDATWSTLDSDHLPITVTPHPRHGERFLLRTPTRLTGRDLQQRQRGNSLKHLCQPPALLEKKCSGVSSATQVYRGWVSLQKSQSPSREKPTSAWRRLHKPSTGSLLPVLPNMSGHSKGSWGTSTATIVWSPLTGCLTREASQRPLGRQALPPPRGLTGLLSVLHLRPLGEHGLTFLAELFNL